MVKEINLCRGKKCCPVAYDYGEWVSIVDDDGTTIRLTREQLQELFIQCGLKACTCKKVKSNV